MSRKKIKKIMGTLIEGSQNVRINPSEQNYRKWEQKIEHAGRTSRTPYIIAGIILVVFICVLVGVSGGSSQTQTESFAGLSPTQTAIKYSQISDVSVEHNVFENDQKGMRIHINFNVINKKDTTCEITAYFRYRSGTPLKDYNNSYTTSDGHVSVGQTFTPKYYNTSYNDIILFMPYNELHINSAGKYDLEFFIQLHDKRSNELLAESNYYSFSLTNTQTSPLPTPTIQKSSPLKTPAPTKVTSCNIPVYDKFREVWQLGGGFSAGCPTGTSYQRRVAFQPFENGFMLWRAASSGDAGGMIYVVYNSGRWQEYRDDWVEGMRESAGFVPPNGLVEPKRGFGNLWTKLGGPDSSIGWALQDEVGSDFGILQDFPNNAVIFHFPNRPIVFMPDGKRWVQK